MPQNSEICTSTCTCVQLFEQGSFTHLCGLLRNCERTGLSAVEKEAVLLQGFLPLLQVLYKLQVLPLQQQVMLTCYCYSCFGETGACGVLMFNPFRKTTLRGIVLFVYKNPEARVQFPRPVAFDVTIN